jgi:hypothetical protein
MSRVSSLPQPYVDIKMPVPPGDNYSQDQYPDVEYAKDEGLCTFEED